MAENILITGVTGLVGSALAQTLGAETLRSQKRNVIGQVRGEPKAGQIKWDLLQPRPANDRALLNTHVDAVVHLAGDPVFGIWTAAKKQRIRDSRVIGTRNLTKYLAGMPADRRPRAMICASAVGYYGDRGDEALAEDSCAGKGFLAETCVEWEAAAAPASDVGIRVVHLRLGIVLTDKGGALKSMLPAFKLGVGGRLGSGDQWMPWVALDDVIEIILYALDHEDLSGAVNAVGPSPVTNEEFSKTLGRLLERPAVLPVPDFALKMLPGGMGQAMFLASERVIPQVLQQRNFGFQYPTLEHALQRALGSN